MSLRNILLASTSIATVGLATASYADVTAQQVWDDWKSQLQIYGDDGLTVSGETMANGVLTVSDVTLKGEEDDVSIVAEIGNLTFTEQGDGTVRVGMAPSYPITFSSNDFELTLLTSMEAVETLVSGTPDAMTYDLSAARYQIEIAHLSEYGDAIPGDARLTAYDLRASYQSTPGALNALVFDGSLGRVNVLIDFADPDGSDEYVTMGADLRDVALALDTALPMEFDVDNPDFDSLRDAHLVGSFGISGADYVFDINDNGDIAQGSVTTGSSLVEADLSFERLSYATMTNDITLDIVTPDLPMPLRLSADNYGYGVSLPTARADEAQTFDLSIDFSNIAINDAIWDMFDPGAVLPRDPITLQLEVFGKLRPLFDFLDPAQAAAIADAELPVELHSFTLDTLRVSGLGAMLSGSGALLFDNDDTQTFAPFPRPEGTAGLQIDGLNALLDNLIEMGLVQQGDIMGPRMMMGMFARSVGDDQMAVDVEILEGGEVRVNGNRVR